jgi:predicted glycoside hydrolase/deacetylase ChbG (UPF0249 family)
MGEKSERLLIVNADDLGRTPGINEGIFDAHRRGLVTSATLMVAYPAARAAAAALGELPGLGVGLHVALTGGPSVSSPKWLPSLVDGEGILPRRPVGLARVEPDELLLEIRAQLRRFRELTGREPTHLDSHHHSQRVPAVFDAMVLVARENGLAMRRAAPGTRHGVSQAGVLTTDAFVEDFFGADATVEILLGILRRVGSGSTEVMCHPARVDRELRESSTYAEDRERELAVLTDPEVVVAVRDEGLRLVHFGALDRGRTEQ